MDWFKKHVDAVVILSAFGASVLWMNGKFNEVDGRFTALEKDIVMIKTVLIIRKIMPGELAKGGDD
jgi:hypothetical protein